MKIILISLLMLLQVSVVYAGDRDITLKQVRDKNVVIRDIGNDEMIMVIMTHHDGSSHWFLLKEYENRKLGNDLCAFYQLDSLSASPDNKYLAVLSIGEGHPILEVVDLEQLRNQGKYKVLQAINPYPGIISFVHWQGSQLILSSDAPIIKMKKDTGITVEQLFPESKQFSLDIITGAIKRVKK